MLGSAVFPYVLKGRDAEYKNFQELFLATVLVDVCALYEDCRCKTASPEESFALDMLLGGDLDHQRPWEILPD